MSEDLGERARYALERVCSGTGAELPARYYGTSFVDHVNDLEFHGLSGVERSVSLYRRMLDDLAIHVEEQILTPDRVTSRFVITGTSLGRAVRFRGITISRFENGLIVEDWSVTDTLGMLRQLGLARSLLAGLRMLRALPRPGTAM
jgi:predicted ester cyclase